MATIRKHNNKWQSIVRVVGYPQRTQSFTMKSDAVAWSKQVELDIQRTCIILKNKISYVQRMFRKIQGRNNCI